MTTKVEIVENDPGFKWYLYRHGTTEIVTSGSADWIESEQRWSRPNYEDLLDAISKL